MSRWYVPSLLPILVLSGALALLVVWRDRRHWPTAAYCASVCAWSAAILLAARPETRAWGDRTMMVAFFVPATFLHVAARELGWGGRVVTATYAVGAAMAATGLAVPGLFLVDGGTRPGPAFAAMFAATVLVGGLPVGLLWLGRGDDAERRRYLLLAGAAMVVGAAANIALMLTRTYYPLGLYLLCASIGVATYVAQVERLPTFSRFVERSQRYALLAALLSAAWMLVLVSAVRLAGDWTWEAALLLFVLAFTAQPLLTEARIQLTDRVFPGQGDGEGLARALATSEARAEHAGRLAEIGTMASAVAHEVRNPLGVIAACAAVLERGGADAEVVAEIRAQVDRAARFADDLLEYGRPAPPQRRPVSVGDAARLAGGEVRRALGIAVAVDVAGEAEADADPSQLVRLFAILVENAALAGASRVAVDVQADAGRIRVGVEDDGPGVDPLVAERLFTPFVSGRGRGGPRPGTGLGLAIAQGIAHRHDGTLVHEGRGASGGARFALVLRGIA